MSEAIQFAVVAAVSALLGVIVTSCFEKSRRRDEERRWYAEFFLSRKVDALHQLYHSLNETFNYLNLYGNLPPSTRAEYTDQVLKRVDSYLMSKISAALFLDDAQSKILDTAVVAYRQASFAIFLSLPESESRADRGNFDKGIAFVDWKLLESAYDGAGKCLREMLNPNVLRNLEETIGHK